ncbi:MAG: DNA-binding response regulator [Chloroflexi bacterium RBG_13_56_8]|nr:MAG: DNA-binding response regulator [Chloroflexi bacterium RBG_13_56_8]
MSPGILVVDDDVKTVNLVRLYLEREGYEVLGAHDGRTALEFARQHNPDLVVLDLMLPLVDGLDVCRILRAETEIPIIMLTAKSTENDKLLGLDLGADDYVTKPFSPRELAARVRAVLRRTTNDSLIPEVERITQGDLTVDFARHEVVVAGQLVRLTPSEFHLLEVLMREPNRVYTRAQLQDKAFGYDYEGLERTVDVHIMNLRRKIEPDLTCPRYVLTVYGVGYKFAGSEDDA